MIDRSSGRLNFQLRPRPIFIAKTKSSFFSEQILLYLMLALKDVGGMTA
jgi:hypothetical protein